MRRRTGILSGAVVISVILAGANVAGRTQSTSSDKPTPNAVIGRVVDKAGHPVAGVFVSLLKNTVGWNGVSRLGIAAAHAGTTTDADGHYVIDHVPFGPYYVVALPHNATGTPDGHVNRTGHGVAYYPAASSPAEAREVTVTMTAPVTADIALVDVTLAVVTGTVIGQDGTPVLTGGMLGITHGDHMFGIDDRGMRLRPDGSFVLPAMPPGTYFLMFHEGHWPPLHGTEAEMSEAKVVVAGRDLAGIRVAPVHWVHATGHIVIDPADRTLFQLTRVQVGGTPVSFDGNPGPGRTGTVASDLTFDFDAWPGMNHVRVSTDSPVWTVKAIRHGGADVTSTGVDFKAGQVISGIEVEIGRSKGRGLSSKHP